MITGSSMHNRLPETICRLPVECLNNKELLLIYHDQQDLDTRNELVKRYAFIVEKLSGKYANRGIHHEQIRRAASRGLMTAVDRFDVERDHEFTGFATSTIIDEIKGHLREQGWYARLPQRIRELSGKITLSTTMLMQKLNRTPKILDFINYLDGTEEEIIEALEAAWEKSPTPGEQYRHKFLKTIRDNTAEKTT
jgi:RNA polymerase sigma-B factor